MIPTPSKDHKDLFVNKEHRCEYCQIKGKKKWAFREMDVKGLKLWLCWDCCMDEVLRKKSESKPKRDIPEWEDKHGW
jgi:hypothetical protein